MAYNNSSFILIVSVTTIYLSILQLMVLQVASNFGLFRIMLFSTFLLYICLGEELLCHRYTSLQPYQIWSISQSNYAVDTLTGSVQAFHLCHILANTWYYQCFKFQPFRLPVNICINCEGNLVGILDIERCQLFLSMQASAQLLVIMNPIPLTCLNSMSQPCPNILWLSPERIVIHLVLIY